VALWVPVGIAALVFVLTLSIARTDNSPDSPIVGGNAPAFELRALDGQRVSVADLRGSPVVINFWAPWCIPCRDEAPLLTAADSQFGPQGLRIVGIVYQDTAENARDFMRRYGQTYPAGRTAIDYGVLGIPETFFVDRAGIVRSRQVGALTAEDLGPQIEAILP
jgi:cytochrome c biogenesis protein CcmG/thiol:disulfide interchange protein DsbE